MIPDVALKKELTELEVYCPNNGCEAIVALGGLQDHTDKCDFRSISCLYCKDSFISLHFEEHLNVCGHFILECTACFKSCTRLELKTYHKECIVKPKSECYQSRGSFTNLDEQKTEQSDAQAKIYTKFVEHIHLQLNSLKSEVGRLNEAVQTLSLENSKLKNSISILERNQERNAPSSRYIEEDPGSSEQSIFRIQNYEQKKQNALNNTEEFFYTESMLSHKHGYKSCLKFYPNGNGSGKNTHCSIYFALMKGEWDNLLKWPFRQRVSLTIFDQKFRRHHIVETFRPDPTSMSFQKPIHDVNRAYGCPEFVAHTRIDSFIENDTVCLGLGIDSLGLHTPASPEELVVKVYSVDPI